MCRMRLPPVLSEAVVRAYAQAYDVNLDECEPPPSGGAWSSFDAFFTRPLRPGMRSMSAAERHLVSPADGKIESIGPVDLDGTLQVKGRPYRVEELVGDAADAARYGGGQFTIVYLSPRDYHRVHAPVAGAVTRVRSLPGDLYPVNSIGERHVPSLFATNQLEVALHAFGALAFADPDQLHLVVCINDHISNP